MDIIKVNKLNELARTHNQFTNDELIQRLSTTMGWSYKYSKKMLGSHCNTLSSWIILSAYGTLDLPYEDFFKWGRYTSVYDETAYYTAKAWKDDGYMNVRFQWICKALGVTLNPEYLYSFDLLSNTDELRTDVFYQTVIKGHFMASYIQDGKVYLADTSSRGVGVLAETYIKKSQFKYLAMMVS